MVTHISELQLNNFRLFKKGELKLHPNLCVFLGDNGCGKTSIIDAISILISGIYRALGDQGLDLHPLPISPRSECRILPENGYRADNCDIKGTLHSYGEEIKLQEIFSRTAIGGLTERHKDEMRYCEGEKRMACYMLAELPRAIPVFARYGTDRNAGTSANDANMHTSSVDGTPLMALVDSLQNRLNFNSFLSWFNQEETVELRNQRSNREHVSKELDAVRKAIVRFFENSERKISAPRFEASPLRFVVTETTVNGESIELDFSQLSDGYRSTIVMVADFARRLAIANKNSHTDPLDGEGILVIDEIDMHLHPKWQYRVIDDLRRTFPNVQIIVTTHSPEVISTVHKDSVFLLHPTDGTLETEHPLHQTRGYHPASIILEVMGAPNAPTETLEFSTYLDCLVCIQQGDIESPSFRENINKTIAHYGENHPMVTEMLARIAAVKRRKSIAAKYSA